MKHTFVLSFYYFMSMILRFNRDSIRALTTSCCSNISTRKTFDFY